jgi:hypothetical protein
MASRKKPPAEVRTIGLFTGLTPLEEAEQAALEEDPFAPKEEPVSRTLISNDETAVRWLGEDFSEELLGDGVRVALGKSGVVVMLVRKDARSVTVKLSHAQWAKLKVIARDGP